MSWLGISGSGSGKKYNDNYHGSGSQHQTIDQKSNSKSGTTKNNNNSNINNNKTSSNTRQQEEFINESSNSNEQISLGDGFSLVSKNLEDLHKFYQILLRSNQNNNNNNSNNNNFDLQRIEKFIVEQNKTLQMNIQESIISEISSLRKDEEYNCNSLLNQMKNNNNEVGELKVSVNQLQKRNDQLESINKELTKRIQELNDLNEEVLKENDRLKGEMESIQMKQNSNNNNSHSNNNNNNNNYNTIQNPPQLNNSRVITISYTSTDSIPQFIEAFFKGLNAHREHVRNFFPLFSEREYKPLDLDSSSFTNSTPRKPPSSSTSIETSIIHIIFYKSQVRPNTEQINMMANNSNISGKHKIVVIISKSDVKEDYVYQQVHGCLTVYMHDNEGERELKMSYLDTEALNKIAKLIQGLLSEKKL